MVAPQRQRRVVHLQVSPPLLRVRDLPDGQVLVHHREIVPGRPKPDHVRHEQACRGLEPRHAPLHLPDPLLVLRVQHIPHRQARALVVVLERGQQHRLKARVRARRVRLPHLHEAPRLRAPDGRPALITCYSPVDRLPGDLPAPASRQEHLRPVFPHHEHQGRDDQRLRRVVSLPREQRPPLRIRRPVRLQHPQHGRVRRTPHRRPLPPIENGLGRVQGAALHQVHPDGRVGLLEGCCRLLHPCLLLRAVEKGDLRALPHRLGRRSEAPIPLGLQVLRLATPPGQVEHSPHRREQADDDETPGLHVKRTSWKDFAIVPALALFARHLSNLHPGTVRGFRPLQNPRTWNNERTSYRSLGAVCHAGGLRGEEASCRAAGHPGHLQHRVPGLRAGARLHLRRGAPQARRRVDRHHPVPGAVRHPHRGGVQARVSPAGRAAHGPSGRCQGAGTHHGCPPQEPGGAAGVQVQPKRALPRAHPEGHGRGGCRQGPAGGNPGHPVGRGPAGHRGQVAGGVRGPRDCREADVVHGQDGGGQRRLVLRAPRDGWDDAVALLRWPHRGGSLGCRAHALHPRVHQGPGSPAHPGLALPGSRQVLPRRGDRQARRGQGHGLGGVTAAPQARIWASRRERCASPPASMALKWAGRLPPAARTCASRWGLNPSQRCRHPASELPRSSGRSVSSNPRRRASSGSPSASTSWVTAPRAAVPAFAPFHCCVARTKAATSSSASSPRANRSGNRGLP
ncbi:hypothetical protein STIAU_7896 [Stigmatella aurantiaca DW4/3-1]|uniref:Uncharacterized protein n=1 Tax=Stigmatella aurantiaca (strain DW4/3-1) TaxID=378806 RepID=Q095J6_STIAD|nr:hypothetical protein STIAU_7896 [Stigmatella aurantiaca DW4/3-1]